MKKTKKQFIFIFIIFISLFIFGTRNARAASVSFSTPASVKVGDNMDVTVNADTGGVLVNSVELSVSYDENMLYFTGYSDNNSVIKIWINPPSAGSGEISLSGIIPGGVDGLYDVKQKGLSPFPVVHLFFTAKNSGNTSFSFVNSKILEADGVGTPLPHDSLSANITIRDNPSGNKIQAPTNTTEKTTSNNTNPQSEVTPDKPDPLFWITIFVIIAGFLIYKLLKYKV